MRERERGEGRENESEGGERRERGVVEGERGIAVYVCRHHYFKDIVYIVYTLPSFLCFRLPWRP